MSRSPSACPARLLATITTMALLGACAATPHFEQPGVSHGPACPAIDAARAIDFSGDRARALARIARQPALSPHEIEFITQVVREGRLFSGDAAGVLVLLARHPTATDQTRRAAADASADLDLFSADRALVAAALAEAAARTATPSERPETP
ncbi:MAG: hypothetical protein JNK35_11500 [Phycisphaerae bacterium]|nr:hypothetical protein [Phycisphaerae bacterium]